MGCLTAVALVVFLFVAFVAGGFWAVHHLRHEYSSTEPLPMPEVITSDEAAPPQDAAPDSALQTSATPVPVRETEKRWKAFEKAADKSEPKRIEMNAGEINALLQTHRNTRGKVFVWIEGSVGKVRVSIPLKNVPLMKGRYLNGEATVETAPDGDPNKVRISNIVLSNNSVADGVMDRRLFGWSSMRGMMLDWLNKQNISSVRIEDNRVIGETRGN